MKRYKLVIFSITLCIMLLLSACGQTGAPSSGAEGSNQGEEKIKVGFLVSDPSEGFWKEVLESLQAACKDNNVDFTYQIVEDSAQMRSGYDSLVAQKVDIIVDGYAVEEIALAYAEEAVADGIPFLGVAFESPVDGAYSYGTSNEGLGEFFGEHAIEYVKKEWDGVIDLIVTANAYTAVPAMASRTDKAAELLQDEFGSDIEWVKLDAESDFSSLGSKTTNMLTAHPDAQKIIYISCSDTVMPNIVTAVEDAGFEDKIMMLSCDCTETFKDYVKESASLGEYRPWYGSIDLNTSTYGYKLLDKIFRILDETETQYYTEHSGVMITAENINDYYPD